MTMTRIGIIGAGAAGLAALKTLLDTPEVQSGQWIPTIFESSPHLGGIWHPSHTSPLYDTLTTNLPHPIMCFPSFPFPAGTPLFPPAAAVQRYLEAYADHFNLRKYIRFNSSVVHVHWQDPYWHVRVRHSDGNKEEEAEYTCSLLLVCNGHHNIARIPSLPGLSSWLSSNRASHSQTYRNPSSISLPQSMPLHDATILIVGSGPSGLDISAELTPLCKRVLLSSSSSLSTSDTICTLKPRTSHFSVRTEDKTVYFTDGSSEEIDYCILATGYKVSFPFFPSHPDSGSGSGSGSHSHSEFALSTSLIPSPLTSIPLHTPLTNTSYSVFPLARHLFGLPSCGFSSSSPSSGSSSTSTSTSTSSPESNPTDTSLPPPTSLAFLGLLVRVAPLPIVESQARAAIAVFRASLSLSLSQSHSQSQSQSQSYSQSDTQTQTQLPQSQSEPHARDAKTRSIPINWTHEYSLIQNRHEMLSSKFIDPNSNSNSKPNININLTTSPSTSTSTPITPTTPPTLPTPPQPTSPTSDSPNTPLPLKLKLKLDLPKLLSAKWDHFEPSDQFEYRDMLDDIDYSLFSSQSPTSPQSTPTPTHNPTRHRVRKWELPLYMHKNALRQGWRLLETRGLSSEWVRDVGSGSGKSGKSGEEEWVAFMWRVLGYWREEGGGGGEGGGEEGEGGKGEGGKRGYTRTGGGTGDGVEL